MKISSTQNKPVKIQVVIGSLRRGVYFPTSDGGCMWLNPDTGFIENGNIQFASLTNDPLITDRIAVHTGETLTIEF